MSWTKAIAFIKDVYITFI